jgi:hypothetical protein
VTPAQAMLLYTLLKDELWLFSGSASDLYQPRALLEYLADQFQPEWRDYHEDVTSINTAP